MIESRTMPTEWVLVMATGPSRKPGFFNPGGCRSSHHCRFAQTSPRRRRFRIFASAGKQHGHAGADRALAHLQFAFAANQGDVTDFYTLDVGDGRRAGPGGPSNGTTQRASPRPALGEGGRSPPAGAALAGCISCAQSCMRGRRSRLVLALDDFHRFGGPSGRRSLFRN